MSFLYTLLIWLYGVAIRLAALFSVKARHWVQGRRNLLRDLEGKMSRKEEWIWFHVASLGEFEQGRPVIEGVRTAHPGIGILLTFFSPSGYLVRKNYPVADVVTYLPLDTPWNAKRFIEIVQPSVAVFVKYDLWYHHLLRLEAKRIPTFLISANLRAGQVYFRPWGGFLRSRLMLLTRIFTQTEEGAQMLRERKFRNAKMAGDTRLDRVLEIASKRPDLTWLKELLPDKPILVAGSTWPRDENVIIPAALAHDLSLVIAPHEISPDRISSLQRQIPGAETLSSLREHPRQATHVIVDTMGELSALYQLGTVAYVGGGFGKGIHNTLEPVAFRLPVIIGPEYRKFVEARILKERGIIHVVQSADEAETVLTTLLGSRVREQVRAEADKYISAYAGATEVILEELLNDI